MYKNDNQQYHRGKQIQENQMGQFTGQLDVLIVPGKSSPVELKGIDGFVFLLTLKHHRL